MVLPVIGQFSYVLPRQAVEDVVGEPAGCPDDEADYFGSAWGLAA